MSRKSKTGSVSQPDQDLSTEEEKIILERARKMGLVSTLYLRDIPTHIKDQFKGVCGRRGITMTMMLIRLMRREIRLDSKGQFRPNKNLHGSAAVNIRAERTQEELDTIYKNAPNHDDEDDADDEFDE